MVGSEGERKASLLNIPLRGINIGVRRGPHPCRDRERIVGSGGVRSSHPRRGRQPGAAHAPFIGVRRRRIFRLHGGAGRAALDLAKKEKPALAVVDILLPDLMGFDVAEALKRLQIPFVLMSGVHKGGKTNATALSKYGALAFFEKPFERRALLDAVRKKVPVTSPGRESLAFDVESGPQVAEAAEAMQLTARIDLQSGSMKGTSPLQLRPMNRDQMARLRDRPPHVQSRKVDTGPIAPASQPDPALQPLAEKDGIRRGT